VDPDPGRLAGFQRTYDVPHGFQSVDQLLAADAVDAVAIAAPDPQHKPIALACLAAGKHVLCEKPLALDVAGARAMARAAGKAGVVNMVHFNYRNWAPIQKIARLVQSGQLGAIRHVEASYHQSWLVSHAWGEWRKDPKWLWRLSDRHGSKGTLGDVGVHLLDLATFPVGPIRQIYCQLKTFPKAPRNRIGAYQLDSNDTAVLTVEFANGAIGSLQTTRWMTGHLNRIFLKIAGTRGSVSFDSERSTDSFRICRGPDIHTDTWQTLRPRPCPHLHQRFIRSIRIGTPTEPDFARGAEVQKLLDASFRSHQKQTPVRIR
jgi:predicted dehydrogenase